MELNPTLIKRAAKEARDAGLASHLSFVRQDFNKWRPRRTYQGVVANQSLHHVTNLEGLFDAVRRALAPRALFAINDIIGRNGHQRWPEAQHLVERFWKKLPISHRFQHQFKRYEERFRDWDCSAVGFEGIRAQDVLPLLLERFHFHAFVGYGNVVDPFVDRGFGPNFDAGAQWDRTFIDCVHACDERALQEGYLTPTHVLAVVANEPTESPYYARGLTPQAAVRSPDRVVGDADVEAMDRALSVYFDIPPVATESGGLGVRLPLVGCVVQDGDAVGAFEDGWASSALTFSVVPERDVSGVNLHATVAEGIAPGTDFSADVNGFRTSIASTARNLALHCPVRLPRGVRARIQLTVGATANLKELGLGSDERELGFHVDDVVFEP